MLTSRAVFIRKQMVHYFGSVLPSHLLQLGVLCCQSPLCVPLATSTPYIPDLSVKCAKIQILCCPPRPPPWLPYVLCILVVRQSSESNESKSSHLNRGLSSRSFAGVCWLRVPEMWFTHSDLKSHRWGICLSRAVGPSLSHLFLQFAVTVLLIFSPSELYNACSTWASLVPWVLGRCRYGAGCNGNVCTKE